MKTIYLGGAVYTGTLPLRQAFVVEGDKFTFAGSDTEALELWREGDEKVDLQGRFVCPGFIDSHMHVLNYGQTLTTAPLHRHTRSLEGMLDCLRAFLGQEHGRGGWLLGRGWNQDYFSDAYRMPNRWDLDQVSTEVPICAVRACGHALSVNSRALELLGITGDTPQMPGGEIVMENGQPNGVFLDNAMELVYAGIPAPDTEGLKSMIRSACAALNARGITGAHSDDFCVFHNVSWQDVHRAYRELEAAGELTVRVYEQCNFSKLPDLEAFLAAGNNTGTGTALFRTGPLKMLGDGALGARTAYLCQPYADEPSTRGLPIFSQQTFDEMIGCANAHGMQAAVHAIGDGCLDQVLSAMEKALAANPRQDHRHGIVHCQITRPDQLEKIARLGLHVYAQSIFLDYDIRIVEPRVGKALAATSYSWKTLKTMGATVSNGSDCPVEMPDVLGGIQCAVTRKPLAGDTEAYLPHEAFTVQEALDSFTQAGAYASFEEDCKGRIQPGMLADFVILEQNPFDIPPEALGSISVLSTYLGGKKVYSR